MKLILARKSGDKLIVLGENEIILTPRGRKLLLGEKMKGGQYKNHKIDCTGGDYKFIPAGKV